MQSQPMPRHHPRAFALELLRGIFVINLPSTLLKSVQPMNSQGVICNELNDQLITNGYSLGICCF
jgi:hypothetical protein